MPNQVGVETHKEACWRARNAFPDNGGMPSTESTLIGTIGEIRDKVAALHEAGAEYLILSILGGSRHTLHRFAAEIVPEFGRDPLEEPGPAELAAVGGGPR
ncbi:hypothetical protein QMZ05_11320 [Bradyrhizobium sp. INPA03-11B]|uniref:hypothetical protein n=1 Tax=Bradyrhizobium sp. INPA03-11B TaxID=418598 RepID=UPI00338E5C56